MTDRTEISWADSTFNPWMGCTKVSPACDHCYAERDMDTRLGRVKWGVGQPRVRTKPGNWAMPLRWNISPFVECMGCAWRGDARGAKRVFNPPGFYPPVTEALECPHCKLPLLKEARRRVFCASLADWLDNEVPIDWLVDLLALIRSTPNVDWLLLTKRIGNFKRRLSEAYERACSVSQGETDFSDWLVNWVVYGHCPANVWVGSTVVDQQEVDRDVPKLLRVPAAVRFLSVEPMLGDISFEGCWVEHSDPAMHQNWLEALDWIICGGESGPQARPIHPKWVRSLRDQCQATGVSFHFKQWGEWGPEDPGKGGYVRVGPETYMHLLGKKAAGRLLDGRTWDGFPQVVA